MRGAGRGGPDSGRGRKGRAGQWEGQEGEGQTVGGTVRGGAYHYFRLTSVLQVFSFAINSDISS